MSIQPNPHPGLTRADGQRFGPKEDVPRVQKPEQGNIDQIMEGALQQLNTIYQNLDRNHPVNIEGLMGVTVMNGDITESKFEQGSHVVAVNAANAKLKRFNTTGTNKAFTKVTDPKEWDATASKVDKLGTFTRKRLKPTEAVLGPIIRKDANFKLVHALGPELTPKTKLSELDLLQEQVYQTYCHAFDVAAQEHADFVQVPRISTGSFLESASDDVKQEWPKRVNEAFLKAAHQYMSEGKFQEIRLVVYIPTPAQR